MSTSRGDAKGPYFVRFMGPILEALNDLGGSGRRSEVADLIAHKLEITEETLNETVSTGASRFVVQVNFARLYLVKGGLLESSSRGVWNLTERGREAHLTQETALEVFRHEHKKMADARALRKAEETASADEELEAVEDEFQEVDYREQVLGILKELPPAGFEKLCQRLLRESGFTSVEVTGKSGDEGIDGEGVLRLNAFVTFKVLFQCKRYSKTVSPSVVRDFRGGLVGRADKGLILTTGTFTAAAKREASREGALPIELIDGDAIVDLFEELRLGLKPRETFDVDESFFDSFRD